jgi:hypothetical protein
MATGIIDSSTLYEVIHLFRERGMADTSAWTWHCSTEVTSGLIHGRQLGIAHTPALLLYPGPWGYIQSHLADQTTFLKPPLDLQRQARRIVNDWALSEDGVRLLRRSIDPSYYSSKDEQKRRSFARYQENMVAYTWPALVGPHDIFERRNIQAISRVTGVTQREMTRVYNESKDIRNLRRFASNLSPDDELFARTWHAYLIDLLIRGRYHDEVARMEAARLRGGQHSRGGLVLHHPARNPVLRQLPGSQTRYEVTNTDRAFSNILLAGALAERNQQKRIDLWLENVLTARKAARSGEIDFAAQDDDKVAERIAAERARSLGIRTHARMFDEVTDVTIAGGLGYLTSFVLTGWTDVAIAAGTYVVAKSQEFGTRVGRLAFERRNRLERLASSSPGRVEREWSGSCDPKNLTNRK